MINYGWLKEKSYCVLQQTLSVTEKIVIYYKYYYLRRKQYRNAPSSLLLSKGIQNIYSIPKPDPFLFYVVSATNFLSSLYSWTPRIVSVGSAQGNGSFA